MAVEAPGRPEILELLGAPSRWVAIVRYPRLYRHGVDITRKHVDA